MFNRKFSAILLSALILTACSDNAEVQQAAETTAATTAETTTAVVTAEAVTEVTTEKPIVEETKAATEKAEITEAEQLYKYFEEHGYDYSYDFLKIYMNNDADPITSLDKEMLEKVTYIRIFDAADNDLNFIECFPNLTSLTIHGYSGDFYKIIDIVNSLNLKTLYILTHNYDPADAETLIKTLPECVISYSRDDSPWMNDEPWRNDYRPEKDVIFYTQPSIPANSLLRCVFSNYSDTVKTIESAQLFRIYGGEQPILFTNGTDTLKLNFELPSMKKTDFELSDEMLDYSTLEAGIYKIVFTCGDEKLEQQFSVNGNSTPVFLTEEQLEIFNEEHESRYKQAVLSDRGFDISSYDEFFLPVYSDENEVIFQNIVTHAHEDNPYFIWFETLNYRMVKTDDGWKFDIFQLWY